VQQEESRAGGLIRGSVIRVQNGRLVCLGDPDQEASARIADEWRKSEISDCIALVGARPISPRRAARNDS
jgi:hypothetical protein